MYITGRFQRKSFWLDGSIKKSFYLLIDLKVQKPDAAPFRRNIIVTKFALSSFLGACSEQKFFTSGQTSRKKGCQLFRQSTVMTTTVSQCVLLFEPNTIFIHLVLGIVCSIHCFAKTGQLFLAGSQSLSWKFALQHFFKVDLCFFCFHFFNTFGRLILLGSFTDDGIRTQDLWCQRVMLH